MNTHTSPSNGIFILRLSLGVILLAHGLLKLLVFTIPGTVAYFGSLGMPAIVAYLVIFGEIVGGAALIMGVYARMTALLSLPILVGATWAHINNGWLFSNQGGGWEFPVLLIVVALTIISEGPGRYAVGKIMVIDSLIPNRLKD